MMLGLGTGIGQPPSSMSMTPSSLPSSPARMSRSGKPTCKPHPTIRWFQSPMLTSTSSKPAASWQGPSTWPGAPRSWWRRFAELAPSWSRVGGYASRGTAGPVGRERIARRGTLASLRRRAAACVAARRGHGPGGAAGAGRHCKQPWSICAVRGQPRGIGLAEPP